MLSSFLIKLSMMIVTMVVVFWIGWSVPQSRQGAGLQGRALVQSVEENFQRVTGSSELTVDGVEQASGRLPVSPRPSTRPVSEKLNLNVATEQEIESLPGIGPVLAGRIVEYRQSRGAFRNVGQLRHVKGIGKKKFDRIRTLISVSTPSSSGPGKRKKA
ncbi:ComEA family DNA-binding protein [Petrachloros mirabilis]